MVGSSEDGLRLRLRLSWSLAVLVQCPYSSNVRRSLRPLPRRRWSGLRLRLEALSIRPLQEGVVFAISGRRGLSTRFASFATPGYGESPERNSVFHPNYGFVPMAAAPVNDRHDGDGGEENGCNFRRRRSSLPSVSSSTGAASS
jgi:hypothetical protein